MEQVKRYAGRAAALALACFVVAFSVSVSAAAYSESWVSDVALIATLYYSNDSYDMDDSGVVYEMPVIDNDIIASPIIPDSGKTISSVRSNVHIYNPPAEPRVRLSITFYAAVSNLNLTANCAIQAQSNDGSWHSLPFTIISSRSSFISNQNFNDYLIEFSIASGIERIAVYATWNIPGGYKVSSSNPVILGCSNLAFVPIDPVVDQDQADKNATDRVDGAVTDKTQQSNQITNQIEQLQKPNVDSSSGKPVVGGMVVDPMQQVDRDSFNAYTNVLGTIFGSSTILGYFIIVFSLIFISYVIFGKSGG